jgi:hypothetical protein
VKKHGRSKKCDGGASENLEKTEDTAMIMRASSLDDGGTLSDNTCRFDPLLVGNYQCRRVQMGPNGGLIREGPRDSY